MRPNRRIQPRSLLTALCTALAALGCATLNHHLEAAEYEGRPLSTRSAAGAHRLRSEMQIDPTVAAYVKEKGRPDYLYLESSQKLYLFYLATDSAAMFERVIATSKLTELGRIPGILLEQLPEAEQRNILAMRSQSARRAQSRARAARRAIARSEPPASRARGSATIGTFPAADIVARMRPPLTAADPGVSGWHETALRGGGHVYTAKVGSTRYEVRDDRVAFTVSISSAARRLPASARLAMQRVNNAVFGSKANAVTDRMMKLAARAAADRTGRTSFAERVAGRTIRIGRLVDAGVLAYSVHP